MSAKPSSNNDGIFFLNEMREFASFPSKDQKYIRRSLDVVFDKASSVRDIATRYKVDDSAISQQKGYYKHLTDIQNHIPYDGDLSLLKGFFDSLVITSTFDLSQECLSCFSSYRFLYERLLGPEIRPYLPSAFCAAAAMPTIPPASRKTLLHSISEAAATAPGWSQRKPAFIPAYIDLE